MIDIRKIRFDGSLNHHNGLTFYCSNRGRSFCFLIVVIGDRKRRVRVTMQPDINHVRPHVHIDRHRVSFAIDTGELLAGNCDGRTCRVMKDWIGRHRNDLNELWDAAKRGDEIAPLVNQIKKKKSFEEFGFKGVKPRNQTFAYGMYIWHEEEIVLERTVDGSITIVGDGNIYVGLPEDFPKDKLNAQSLSGRVLVSK